MIVFWGCNLGAGHYLWRDDHDTWLDFDAERLGLPTPSQLDATRLFLPRPEQKGEGMLTYLPAPNLTVLAWWGSPFDKRGAVNSAVIVGGKLGAYEVWAAFEQRFPRLAPQVPKPTLRETA